jgi:hypothetical protein
MKEIRVFFLGWLFKGYLHAMNLMLEYMEECTGEDLDAFGASLDEGDLVEFENLREMLIDDLKCEVCGSNEVDPETGACPKCEMQPELPLEDPEPETEDPEGPKPVE